MRLYRAELLRFPEQKVSVACLCNLATTNPSRLARQVAEVYLADKMIPIANPQAPAPAAARLTPSQMASKTGLYRNPSSGALGRITFTEGKLRIDSFGPPSELAALEENRFRVFGPSQTEIVFESDKTGRRRIQLARPGGKPEFFDPVEAASPSPQQLREYAGSYYSDELDTIYVLTVEEGKLYVKSKGLPNRVLQPTFKDGFISEGVQFGFSRDNQGGIGGFAVQAGRIRNVRFEKSTPQRR